MFHLPFPLKLTEKSNRPALYKILLVDETAAEITTKLMIEPALRMPVAARVCTKGLELVETLVQGITIRIATIAKT